MRKSRFRKGKKKSSARLKRVVKNIVEQEKELKRVDVTISTSAPVSGGSTSYYLSAIPQGDDDNDRDGNKIKIVSFQCRGVCTNAATANASRSVARLVVYRATQSIKGVTPAVTEILDTDSVLSLRDGRVQGKYKVLWDKTFSFNNMSGATVNMTKFFKKFISVGGLNCNFDGNSSLVADSLQGGIFMVLMSNQASTDQHTWDIECRVNFKEF